jgi:hypothetical protein
LIWNGVDCRAVLNFAKYTTKLNKLSETAGIGGDLLVTQEFPIEGITDGLFKGYGY